MRICLILSISIFFSIEGFSQATTHFWKLESSNFDKSFSIIQLDQELLRSNLTDVSTFNYNKGLRTKGEILMLPNPDGSSESYEVFETQVMHPKLAARYPMIKTYIGLSKDTPGKHIRFTNSHKRFTGMMFSPNEETAFISKEDAHYICYTKSYYQEKHSTPLFTCGVGNGDHDVEHGIQSNATSNKFAGDCNLRTYRLALACTGEYAQRHGGNKTDVLEEMVVSMVRVNGIYEMDLGITMILIPNNDELIFLNSGTDPYSNNNGGTMLGQNQSTVDAIIGSANYDIGHVYSTGGGGIANLQAPCNPNRKARGVTGLGNPTGDAFWVDYVAHEMGHQFGGNHTQNNDCQRNGPTAMEPGSASTIMGYAGICEPNVQNNSDDHFHAISVQEITNYSVQGEGNNCPLITDTGNSQPTIVEQNSVYNLPIDTPFRLIADATDENEDDVLTYCWEQMDNEVATMPPSPINNQGPTFRSISPVTSPIRYFPRISAILNNTSPTWEVLPIVSRNMDFRCTVRDNAPLNGCTNEIEVRLEFHDNVGPFVVTSQNTSEDWFTFSTQVITWDVAGTDVAPVETPMVDILLSLDGGLTYDIIVAEAVPNIGTAEITVPNVVTTQARVMVTGHDNVFYDINNQNISIKRSSFSLTIGSENLVTCDAEQTNVNIEYEEFEAFNEIVNLSITGLPTEITTSLSQNSIEENGTISVTFFGLSSVNPGNYTFQVRGISDNQSYFTTGKLTILTSTLVEPFLESPANGELGLIVRPTFDWIVSGNIEEYKLEIATNPTFGNTTVVSEMGINPGDAIQSSLDNETVYYWKIEASNSCASNAIVSKTYSFQTGRETCEIYPGLIQPVSISADEVSNNRSLTQVTSNVILSSMKVNVDVQHNFIGDLGISLESQSGVKINLLNRPGVPNSPFGCAGSDLQVRFSDNALQTANDIESTCESGPDPAISGEFQPIDLFSKYTGMSSAGIWSLFITDFKAGDGGELTAWELEVCSLNAPSEMLELSTDTFYVNKGAGLEITNNEISGVDSNPENLRYTLTTNPEFGVLQLVDENGVFTDLGVGGIFTQADINEEKLRFQSLDIESFDSFTFDAVSSQNIWLPNNVLDIKIYGPSSVTQQIADLELTISPNPGSGIYHLNFSSLRNHTYAVNVFSVEGKKIMTTSLSGAGNFAHSLDLTSFSSDMYILVVENERNEQNTYRLVKH